MGRKSFHVFTFVMLNYKNSVVFFTIVLSGVVLADIFRPVSLWWYAGIVFVMVLLLTLGSVNIGMGFYLTSYCHGDRGKKEVSFSFDDGPDAIVTTQVLDILREYGIKSAFFVTGSKVSRNPGLIKRIDLEGHIIGGHSFSHHFFFDLFPAGRMIGELTQTSGAIQVITGKKTRIFRPPYGVTNPALARVLRNLQYHSIGWSLKSKDTVTPDGNKLLDRLKRKVRQGDMVLFHDTLPVVPEVLPGFISFLHEKQIQVVRPDQMLNIDVYG